MDKTPSANRVHIGFFGRRNSGKSSLINAFTGQNVAIVSEVAGTTTDPVNKAMEIHGIGPCLLTDTAGFDDTGALGSQRIEKTQESISKTDIAVLLFNPENGQYSQDIAEEIQWFEKLKQSKANIICIVSKKDLHPDCSELIKTIEKSTGYSPLAVSTNDSNSIEAFKSALIKQAQTNESEISITEGLVNKEDLVLLVMPQDIQAPKGRLILPQVQTIRDLLDKECLVLSTTAKTLTASLKALKKPPTLIITDSQVFDLVYKEKPKESRLTSFSVLFAAYKGDINYYVKSASVIQKLTENSKVLIAECCSHAPLSEDIGREKLPKMLRKRIGQKLTVDIVSGSDFPQDLSSYDLVIQCGGCMFNRKHIMQRIDKAVKQNVPMSNYGVVIAYLTGILDKISWQPKN